MSDYVTKSPDIRKKIVSAVKTALRKNKARQKTAGYVSVLPGTAMSATDAPDYFCRSAAAVLLPSISTPKNESSPHVIPTVSPLCFRECDVGVSGAWLRVTAACDYTPYGVNQKLPRSCAPPCLSMILMKKAAAL